MSVFPSLADMLAAEAADTWHSDPRTLAMQQALNAARAELAAYRSAVVPLADYYRVLERAGHAERLADSMAADIASRDDRRTSRTLVQALDCLQAVMLTLARAAGGPGETRAWNEARAFLAEQGRVSPEVEEMRAAYEQREQERQGR